MNKIFKYTGIVCLVMFSFFYTEKAVNIANSKDPIMQSIMAYEEDGSNKCVEGEVSKDGIILGVNGYSVNVNKSYSNMRGIGFDEELLVFDEASCEVTKKNYLDEYIIKGNPFKNSISLLILVDNGYYLKEINKLASSKGVNLSFIVDVNVLEKNKGLFTELYSAGNDIFFGGKTKEELKKYISIMKDIDRNSSRYCVYLNSDIINICSKEKINSVKSNIFIEKNYLMNIKDFVEKGNLIILKENKALVKELSASINFIKAKGIEIIKVSRHLSEEK